MPVPRKFPSLENAYSNAFSDAKFMQKQNLKSANGANMLGILALGHPCPLAMPTSMVHGTGNY